jgi:hypothetical protein
MRRSDSLNIAHAQTAQRTQIALITY